MSRLRWLYALVLISGIAFALASNEPQVDRRLKNAFRRPQQNGWTFVRLEGTPSEIGFQHGYLLAQEIREAQKIAALQFKHDDNKDWEFFRQASRNILWPHIEREYREELQGIADGVAARGVKLDVWDIVGINAMTEWSYYIHFYNKQNNIVQLPAARTADHCSAFVATGSYTKDGRVVMAHNNWSSYLDGERWTIMFDVAPVNGNHFIMDGYPGLIHSGDDFGINAAGMMITETTIGHFFGWDSNGIPEFVRGRKALQYSASIDDFVRIMKEGNNGGYANAWLVADRKTNEIANLELGLKNVNLQRSKNGYYVGSNFPIHPKLIAEETDFQPNDASESGNARHARWEQLMAENKGKIDVAAGQRFLSDHYDSYAKKIDPNERTLCGHIDLSSRGSQPWQPPYGLAGAVQSKVTDSAMAEHLTLSASAGHSCGIHFKAADHLKKHPEFAWQKEYLRDMNSSPWTTFTAAR